MRVHAVALWSLLGAALSSAAAMALPLPAGAPRSGGGLPFTGAAAGASTHITAGDTLTLDARLGHAALPVAPDNPAETFLFASVTGADAVAPTTAPLRVAVVIDTSGSMAGKRFANAIAAATGMVQRMRDGDTVAVVGFNDRATLVVPPTPITVSTRPAIEARIRMLRVGGETCISCGIDEATQALDPDGALAAEDGAIRRILLLSDGEATAGVRDLPGMRAMASRVRDRGVTITTVGVDVHFDEKMMGAIAVESNGRHYFVEDPSGLPAVFAQEFDSLSASVASNAELQVDLGPGVEVEEVFDRSFKTVAPVRRRGATGRVVVPFGPFAGKQEKTVLMRLRVATDRAGTAPVASVRLAYRDLVQRKEAQCGGALAVPVEPGARAELDPFVAARFERSRTSQTLTEANELFEEGKVAEAREKIARQEEDLRSLQAKAPSMPAPAKAKGVALDEDLENQQRALAQASSGFAGPVATGTAAASAGGPARAAPASAADVGDSRAGKAAVRSNAQQATRLRD